MDSEKPEEIVEWFFSQKILDFVCKYTQEFGEFPRQIETDIILEDVGVGDYYFELGFAVGRDTADFKKRLDSVVKKCRLHEGAPATRMKISFLSDILDERAKKNYDRLFPEDEDVIIRVFHAPSVVSMLAKELYARANAAKP